MNESVTPDALAAASMRLERIARWLSTLRLGAFLAAAGAGAAGATHPLAAWIGVPAGLAAFLGLVLWHGAILDRLERLSERITLAKESRERRSSRRRHPVALPPASGSSPLDLGLPVYREEPPAVETDALTADDLGISPTSGREGGPSTLFGLLNWTSTVFGARRLQRMLHLALQEAIDIRERQAAVAEAAGNAASRDALLASLLPLRAHDLAPLPATLRQDAIFAGRKGLLLWAHFVGTALPASILAGICFADWGWMAAIVPLAAASFLTIASQSKDSTPRRNRLLLLAPLLKCLTRLGLELEASRFASRDWTALQGALADARPHTKGLSRSLALLSFAYYGAIFELWNLFTLWELRVLPGTEAELLRSRERIDKAIGALGEAEALLCLALPLAEQKGFELPGIVEGDRPVLAAEEIGHPLLEADSAVRNPVSLGPGQNILLVTGSNMSGKSTYLKSIGLNAALASAGGPVCARGFRWTPVEIHSDMNVRDSLDDGKSYFQVEVERVRLAIERAGTTPRVLAVFDELFRGTNSTERVALARAILRHLRSTGALVVVATHDASLTRLVTEEREPGMANVHFRESVDGREMRFDYRLREGPATTRNAIRVLEAQGYPEAITREAHRECGEA